MFQIDDSYTTLTVTNITGERIGTAGFFNSDHKLSPLSQITTNTNITNRNNLEPSSRFRSLNGNKLYWEIPAYDPYEATLYSFIINGINHDDEEDVAGPIILGSK